MLLLSTEALMRNVFIPMAVTYVVYIGLVESSTRRHKRKFSRHSQNVSKRQKASNSVTSEDNLLTNTRVICDYPKILGSILKYERGSEVVRNLCFDDSKPDRRGGPSTPISREKRKPRKKGRKKTSKKLARIEKVMDEAVCRPHRTLVDPDIVLPIHESFMPCKFLVRRCGGCCSDRMECVPVKIRKKKKDVLRFRKTLITTSKTEVIYLDDHRKCECRCKINKTDCGPGQIYDPKNCYCRCPEHSYKTCAYRMVWNERECKCICKRQEECTTGMHFNKETCKCEAKYDYDMSDLLYEDYT